MVIGEVQQPMFYNHNYTYFKWRNSLIETDGPKFDATKGFSSKKNVLIF